ncbi:MAG TPA: hypothetical protein VD859_01125 [Nocardioides sp.]|nr:hypothetical protein [Nocardioides sp.]
MTTHAHTRLRQAALGTSLALAATLFLSACGGEDALALGDAADVDYFEAGGTEKVGSGSVTVTDVREGSSAELEDGGFTLDADEKSAAVYYVDVTFENEADAAVTPGRPSGEDPDGNLISALTVIDLGGKPFETCAGVPDEIPAGETAEGCSIILVPEGWELDKISYFPGGDADFIYWETGL